MKKIFLLAVILFSPLSYADYDDYGRRGYDRGHHEHRHHRRQHYQPEARYYPQPPVVYYQQPEVRYYPQPPVRYYQQPEVRHYSQPPQYSGNSLRLSW